MVNNCCLLCTASPFHNDFVANVYTDPERYQYYCPDCGEDASERLGREILKALREQDMTLSFASKIRLRAAVWFLARRYHGVTVSGEDLLKTVRDDVVTYEINHGSVYWNSFTIGTVLMSLPELLALSVWKMASIDNWRLPKRLSSKWWRTHFRIKGAA